MHTFVCPVAISRCASTATAIATSCSRFQCELIVIDLMTYNFAVRVQKQ